MYPTGPHTLGWADMAGRKDYVSREGCILRALLKSGVPSVGQEFAIRALSSAPTRYVTRKVQSELQHTGVRNVTQSDVRQVRITFGELSKFVSKLENFLEL